MAYLTVNDAQKRADAERAAAEKRLSDERRNTERHVQELRRAAQARQGVLRSQYAVEQRMAIEHNKSTFGVFTSGAQSFFRTMGAARSGNYFYGIASASGGIKNLVTDFGSLPGVASKAAIGITGVGAAIAVVTAGVTIAGAKLAEWGIGLAANFQMLQIQMEGLLGSVGKAKDEFSFLMTLGKQSIVPT
jgi:hypothetical protein